MASVINTVLDWIDTATEVYRESALCRALCQGIALLAGILTVDSFLGFPTGTRLIYVLPIWMATKRGGKAAGMGLVTLTTLSLALADSARQGRTDGFLTNLVLQTLVLWTLMSIFDKLERDMRNVTTLATRDSLTGVFNRFSIEERGRKAIDRALVMDQTLSIAMIDCDRFKELNDKFGHAFGDEVLRILGKTMRRSFLNEATIGRAGGDEFIVILPNRDRIQSVSILEATLERFMSHTEIVARSAGFSYGIAVVGEDGFEYEHLLRAADEDMYRRKAARSQIAATLAS